MNNTAKAMPLFPILDSLPKEQTDDTVSAKDALGSSRPGNTDEGIPRMHVRMANSSLHHTRYTCGTLCPEFECLFFSPVHGSLCTYLSVSLVCLLRLQLLLHDSRQSG